MIDMYAIIKEKQDALGLNNVEFCKFLGMTRQWLLLLQYSEVKRPFNNGTMALLSSKLGIPMETMIEYNKQVKLNRLQNKESEK